MGSSKPKKPKQPNAKSSLPRRPQPLDLPVEPVPDFDDSAFLAAVAGFEKTAESLIRHLRAILATGEAAKAKGPTQSLATGEHVGRLTQVIGEAESSIQALSPLLRALRGPLELWKQGERRSRKARFERIAATLQWKIVGSWPEPVVDGIVFVVVDEGKDRALVNGQALLDPTAERLANAVSVELDQLKDNQADPAEFVASLWKAYQASGGSPGNGVLAYDLLAQIVWQRQTKAFQRDPRSNLYHGYSLAQFRADLTHYLSAGSPPFVDGSSQYELEIVGGSFAQDGIFIYLPNADRLATCGRLIFKLAGRGGAE